MTVDERRRIRVTWTLPAGMFTERRRRLTAAAVILTASMALADVAQADPPPTITSATVDSAHHLIVKWTMPSPQVGVNVHWNTDGNLSSDTSPSSPRAGGYGTPMACWWDTYIQPPYEHTCTGNQDVADSATSLVTPDTLQPGTYYVQVVTGGERHERPGCTPPACWNPHFSSVVKVVVPKKGATSPVATTPETEPAGKSAVTFVVTGETKLITKDGKKTVSGGRISLTAGDFIESGARAVALAIEEGRLVLAPHSQFLIGARQKRPWVLTEGRAEFFGKSYTLVAAYAVVRTIGVARFTAESTGRVRTHSGKVDVGNDSPRENHPEDKKHVILTAGFETSVGRHGSPALPKKFNP